MEWLTQVAAQVPIVAIFSVLFYGLFKLMEQRAVKADARVEKMFSRLDRMQAQQTELTVELAEVVVNATINNRRTTHALNNWTMRIAAHMNEEEKREFIDAVREDTRRIQHEEFATLHELKRKLKAMKGDTPTAGESPAENGEAAA